MPSSLNFIGIRSYWTRMKLFKCSRSSFLILIRLQCMSRSQDFYKHLLLNNSQRISILLLFRLALANKRMSQIAKMSFSFYIQDYHRVLACRLTVLETLVAVFDEAFLLDCLNEFNLSYLVNQRSDPLNVTPTENSPPEHILSRYVSQSLTVFYISFIFVFHISRKVYCLILSSQH